MRKKLAVILAATMVLQSFAVPTFAGEVEVAEVIDDGAVIEEDSYVEDEDLVVVDDTVETFDEVAVDVAEGNTSDFTYYDTEDDIEEGVEELAEPNPGVVYTLKDNTLEWRYYPEDTTNPVKVFYTLEDNDPATADIDKLTNADSGWSIKYVKATDLPSTPATKDILVTDIENASVKLEDTAKTTKAVTSFPVLKGGHWHIYHGTTLADSVEYTNTDIGIYNNIEYAYKGATCTADGEKAKLRYFTLVDPSDVVDGQQPPADKVMAISVTATGIKADKTGHNFNKASTNFNVANLNTGFTTALGSGTADLTNPNKTTYVASGIVSDDIQRTGEYFTYDDATSNATIGSDGTASRKDVTKAGYYYNITRTYCEKDDATQYIVEKVDLPLFDNEVYVDTVTNIKGFLKYNTTAGAWQYINIDPQNTKASDMPTDSKLIVLSDCTMAGSYTTASYSVTAGNAGGTLDKSKKRNVKTVSVEKHDTEVIYFRALNNYTNNLTATWENKPVAIQFYSAPTKGSNVANLTFNDLSTNVTGSIETANFVPASELDNVQITSTVCFEEVPYEVVTVCANINDTDYGTYTKCIHKTASKAYKAAKSDHHTFTVDVDKALVNATLTPIISGKGATAKLEGYGIGTPVATSSSAGTKSATYHYVVLIDSADKTKGFIFSNVVVNTTTHATNGDSITYNVNKTGDKDYAAVIATKALNTIKLGASTATCEADGAMAVTEICELCGAEIKTVDTKVLKHEVQENIPEEIVKTAATCTSEGEATVVTKCKICGRELKSETEVIRKLAHNYANQPIQLDITGDQVIATEQSGGIEKGNYIVATTEPTTSAVYVKYSGTNGKGYAVNLGDENTKKDSTESANYGSYILGRTNYNATTSLYVECKECGEKHYFTFVNGKALAIVDKNGAPTVIKASDRYNVTLSVTDVQREDTKIGAAGSITLKATYTDKADSKNNLTVEKTLPYWSDYVAFLDSANSQVVRDFMKAAGELPEEITLNDAAAVQKARTLYEKLNENQKDLVKDQYAILDAAEKKVAELEKAASDAEKVAAAEKAIDDAAATIADPKATTAEKEAAVAAAKKLVSELPEGTSVSTAAAAKLTEAEKAVDEAKKADEAKAAAIKAAEDAAKTAQANPTEDNIAKAQAAIDAAKKAGATDADLKTATDAKAAADTAKKAADDKKVNDAISAANTASQKAANSGADADITAAKNAIDAAKKAGATDAQLATANANLKKAEEKKAAKNATITVNKAKVKKGKKATVTVKTDSNTKITITAKNKKAKNKKSVKINGAKIKFTKKAKAGTYKFTVKTEAGTGYKATTKTIKIKVTKK